MFKFVLPVQLALLFLGIFSYLNPLSGFPDELFSHLDKLFCFLSKSDLVL